jgi:hypothetical protein
MCACVLYIECYRKPPSWSSSDASEFDDDAYELHFVYSRVKWKDTAYEVVLTRGSVVYR